MKKYIFDLDNTLCFTNGNDYNSCLPNIEMIKKVNHLFESGNHIIIYTARGMSTFKGDANAAILKFYDLTKNQIDVWGLKYHELKLGKPSYDFFIDDKNLTIEEFKKHTLPIKGFTAGSFDILHPGYIKMFKEAKENCNLLVVGLHIDPSKERGKMKPILSKEERREILESIKYVDEIIEYKTEKELIKLIKKVNPDVLFLGDDYKNKENNGTKLEIKTHYINRDHGWSSTKLKNEIKNRF